MFIKGELKELFKKGAFKNGIYQHYFLRGLILKGDLKTFKD